ncbi:MAG TPA: hypothetical protein VIU36_03155 [Gammaproteobacteria bacterium]|jgi:tetrahydromethanopterin S-methyltransferase subunit A
MPSKMEEFGFFLTRAFATTRRRRRKWPYVPGKYFVSDPDAPVAVTTLGSKELAEQVANPAPPGLCIVGKVETENIGIEKIIKNILSNANIRYLICAGNEPPKHLTGATIIALFENGMDEHHRIMGSPGMRPVLPNTSLEEVHAFRQQIKAIDMIGCTDVSSIHRKISELADSTPDESQVSFTYTESRAEHISAETVDPNQIILDKAGYFVINIEENRLLVEHYNYQEQYLRTVEGTNARDIYLTIINNDWVTRADHAAYLGAQLMKAEQSIKHGLDFTQDGA